MEAITVTNLSKSFRGHCAVRGLNMHVPEGSIYGMIGENGAGKSTTQKMLCGLLRPTGGEIKLFGNMVSNTDVRANMGVLIEDPGVYLDWTARENLLLQALNIGVSKPRKTVDEALEAVGLGDTGKKKVKEFSLGMKQRLGIAMAFLGSPRILILDEPINGLDPEGIRDVRQTLLRLNQEYRITILISSHILGELSKVATHYGIIRNGCMIKEISAQALSRECCDYMCVKTDQPERALQYLQQQLGPDVGEIVDGALHLFRIDDGAAINQCLFRNGDIASEIYFHHMDLEEYFVSLMGGAVHA